MNSNEVPEIVIEQNRTKTILSLVYVFPILLMGVLGTIQLKNSMLMGVAGIIILVLLTPTYFRVLKQSFSDKPLLKVNQEGIAGWGKFFEWREIEKVALRRDWGAVFLTVYVRNNGRMRKYNINAKNLNGSATELIKQIGVLKSKYK
ncbi:hypothetical protein LISE100100_13285 [Listeria seeligeri]|uniref:hypothetical protein n=1 Tax=Listeria seeligeri TaxID=1640 RepID=UPI0001C4E412|nr:hypothetical protein [Listeria seeligeri]CBH26220.1 hypothetical protein lse_0069 [Listeria seeligeri serovar 1/2b str. SLCC3954]